jgi:serine protease Do
VLQAATAPAPPAAPAPQAAGAPDNPFADSSDPADVFAAFSAPPVVRPATATAPKAAAKAAPHGAGGSEWLMIGGGLGVIVVALGIVVVLILNFRKPSVADAGPVDPDKVGLATVSTVPLSAASSNQKAKLDSAEIFEKHAPSVAVVKGKTGSGSGFLMPGNIIATNNHVVEREFIEDVEIEFPDAKDPSQRGPFKADLLYENPHRDIAFLEIKGDCSLPPLEVADPVEFKQGATITFIGSPGSQSGVNKNDIRSGTLSGKATVDNVDWYSFDGNVWHGNSGGPVFDYYGRVIGIVTRRDAVNENIKYCIPADEILTHFKQMNYRTAEEKKANGSRHRIKALAQRLVNVAGFYSAYLERFVQLMRNAEKDGLDEKDVAAQRKAIQEDVMKQIEKMLPENVDSIIETVKTDSNVPDDVKESFTKLLESYNATKDYFQEIKGVERPSEDDHKQILKKTKELREQQQQVMKKLFERLDEILE